MKKEFSKKLTARYGEYEFRFVLEAVDDRPIYQISFDPNPQENIKFRMQKNDESDQYSICAQALPDWIFEIEPKLSDAIEEANGHW